MLAVITLDLSQMGGSFPVSSHSALEEGLKVGERMCVW